MNFKIIAIKPLEKCDGEYVKVLEKNMLYYFYTNYRIDSDDINETITMIDAEKYPDDLYEIKSNNPEQKLRINISAIVGKNGSGKSSIIDLLFRAINNIAFNFKTGSVKSHKRITADLRLIKGIHLEFYFFTDHFYKITVDNEDFEVYKFKKTANGYSRINVNLKKRFKLSELFYTEAVNYSHYAYNSREFGFYQNESYVDWLKELFHKNDSYQTPLVLNPMRTDGNFDINRENDLVKQRLLANLLRIDKSGNKEFRRFGENLEAYRLEFQLKPRKNKVVYYERRPRGPGFEKKEIYLKKYTPQQKDFIVKLMLRRLVSAKNLELKSSNRYNFLLQKQYSYTRNYILYKIISIAAKYDEYFIYKDIFYESLDEKKIKKFRNFVKVLKEDHSHVTFKLRQVLNYLKNIAHQQDYLDYSNRKDRNLIAPMAKKINDLRAENQSLLELIPPPIFSIDIILKPINQTSFIDIKFSSLSSGEKQQTYLVSSLLYHLYNLDSVSKYKVRYQNINIVLEEIELYFHPELQKEFIKYFLDSIERIELSFIKSINIIFITHSPFILSDIPATNVMFLNVQNGIAVQKMDKKNTFGANIHELLGDSFFMEKGYTGSFAHKVIEETIDWLNRNKIKRESSFETTKVKYEKIIKLIDEPILRLKLGEMYAEISTKGDFYGKLLDEQIDLLSKKRAEHRNQK